LGKRNLIKSIVFVVVVFALLIVVGNVNTSSPSADVIEADRQPTTTTTTEPPPPGVAFVVISNGSFQPSILELDLTDIHIVQWTNEDAIEYEFSSADDLWEPFTLAEGDQFEFDFSTVEPAIHRQKASIGFNRIPGSVDTRPEQ
jgi:hypothetical protein